MSYKLLHIMNEQYQHTMDFFFPEELENNNSPDYSISVDSHSDEECEDYVPCQEDIDLLNIKW
jgi:hypothetical protein